MYVEKIHLPDLPAFSVLHISCRFADAPGQRVKTAFGDGTIISFMEGNSQCASRYRIKLPFGIAFVQPYAVLHALSGPDGTIYVRRNGQMEKEESRDDGDSVRLDKKYRLLFGSEHIYLFVRLFSYLVSLLTEIEEDIRSNPNMVDPASKYYNPMEPAEEGGKQKTRLDFYAVTLNLQHVISRKLEAKDFEAFCRRVSREHVHKMAALPKLVEKCADALLQVAKEDLLLYLNDYCQAPGQVCNCCFGFFV
jgi:hypothetical protein